MVAAVDGVAEAKVMVMMVMAAVRVEVWRRREEGGGGGVGWRGAPLFGVGSLCWPSSSKLIGASHGRLRVRVRVSGWRR